MQTKRLWIACLTIVLNVCVTATAATVKIAPYGVTQAGEKVTAYTLMNDKGASATVLDYGGTIAAIRVPDRQGNFTNVVMSFADMTGWETLGHWTNADIGRYSNIIRNGFTLDGVHYPLPGDARGTTMHSGPATYARRIWSADPIHPKDGASLTLTMDSPDGDQGFPGHAIIKVTYQLSDKNELRLDFVATTDKPTVINLTNHLYLNLNGNSTIPVYDHDLQVMTDQAAVQEAGKGPTGVIQSIVGTPFDFTKPTVIKERLAVSLGTQYDNPTTAPPIPLGMARSFNEPFVLHDGDNRLDRIAARLHDPVSGRVLELRTTERTVHVFTPVAIEAGLLSDAGKPFTRVPSIALETQHLPDSPNHPEFPSTVLRPGQTFHSTTIFAFTTDAKK